MYIEFVHNDNNTTSFYKFASSCEWCIHIIKHLYVLCFRRNPIKWYFSFSRLGYSNVIGTSNVASSTFFYFCRVPYSGAIVSVIATIQIAAKSNNHDCLYCRGVVFVSSLLDKLLYTLSACMLFASLFLCCSCCMLSWWLLQFLPL